jgi:hypothetical protein
MFTAAMTGAGFEISAMRRLQIDQAVQALAVAECARGAYMREGHGDLPDLVAAERRADMAIKRLGLPKEGSKPPTASVADILERVNKGASP